jgi:hypothetical protein
VEYGTHQVMTRDGKENRAFWKMDGCGPSAAAVLPSDEFLVTCCDSGSIARISPDGKTAAKYKKDRDGQAFLGPSDFAVDSRGVFVFPLRARRFRGLHHGRG